MRLVSSAVLLLLCATSATATVRVRAGAGLTDATAARDQFRADLGMARFEINWDEVPDALAAPNAFPANCVPQAAAAPAAVPALSEWILTMLALGLTAAAVLRLR